MWNLRGRGDGCVVRAGACTGRIDVAALAGPLGLVPGRRERSISRTGASAGADIRHRLMDPIPPPRVPIATPRQHRRQAPGRVGGCAGCHSLGEDGRPTGLDATINSPCRIHRQWAPDEVTLMEERTSFGDFAHYRVHHGSEPRRMSAGCNCAFAKAERARAISSRRQARVRQRPERTLAPVGRTGGGQRHRWQGVTAWCR
jgi:hypothetical protein